MAKKRKSASRRSTFRERTASKKSKTPRYVYYFGDGHADGTGKMKPLLGGKGANLAEMTRIGLPVPPGFSITTDGCRYFYAHNRRDPPRPYADAGAACAKVQ